MTMTDADAVAAPVEVTLAGETYTMSPLSMRMLGKIERWAQQQALAREFGAIEALPEHRQADARREARKEAASIRVGTPEFDAALDSYSGTMLAIALALSEHHPELGTMEAVEQLQIKPAEWQEAAKLLADISFPDQPKAHRGKAKAAKSRRRKSRGSSSR